MMHSVKRHWEKGQNCWAHKLLVSQLEYQALQASCPPGPGQWQLRRRPHGDNLSSALPPKRGARHPVFHKIDAFFPVQANSMSHLLHQLANHLELRCVCWKDASSAKFLSIKNTGFPLSTVADTATKGLRTLAA